MKAHRRAFTIAEATAAIGILAIALVLVAQLGGQSLIERRRAEERTAALEAAANILEQARSRHWNDLSPDWANELKLPDFLVERLIEPMLAVGIDAEPERPRVKRITVTIRWQHRYGQSAREAVLVGLFADRSAGGEP